MKLKYFLYLCLIFCSCSKSPKNDEEFTGLNGDVTINGIVYLDNGSAASNVEVFVDGNKFFTNAQGQFAFAGKVTSIDKLIIKVKKSGYLNITKTFVVEPNATYGDLTFRLIPESVKGTFIAENGSNTNFEELQLTIPANAVQKEDGAPYSGTVSVVTALYSFPGDYGIIPGDGRAVDINKKNVVLESFGGMVILLKGQAGEILKLSKPITYGYNATYTEPSSIKLWVFDEKDEIWIENGTATIINKKYTGTITTLTHFQFAKSFEPTLLKGVIKDTRLGNANFSISATPSSYNYLGFNKTVINSNGVFMLYTPAVDGSRFSIGSPCNDNVGVYNIPSIQPNNVTNVSVSPVLTKFSTVVTGRIDDCGSRPVNGRAELSVKGVKYNSALVNGQYSFNVISCDAENGTTISAYDNQNNLVLKPTSFRLIQGIQYKAADITICTRPLTGFINVKAEGKDYSFVFPQDKVEFTTVLDLLSNKPMTHISATNAGANQTFYITYVNTATGAYPIYTLHFGAPQKTYDMAWSTYDPGTINVTQFKSGTTLIQGSFKSYTHLNYSLTAPPGANKVVEIEGKFKIEQP